MDKKKIISIIGTVIVVALIGAGFWMYNLLVRAEEQAERDRQEYERESLAALGYLRETRDEADKRLQLHIDRDASKINELEFVLNYDIKGINAVPDMQIDYLYALMNRCWYVDGHTVSDKLGWGKKLEQIFEDQEKGRKWYENFVSDLDMAINREARIEHEYAGEKVSVSGLYYETLVKTRGFMEGKATVNSYDLFITRDQKDGSSRIVEIFHGDNALGRFQAKGAEARSYFLEDEINSAVKKDFNAWQNRPTKEREDAVFEWVIFQRKINGATNLELRKKYFAEWEEYKKQHPVAVEVEREALEARKVKN